MCGLLSPTGPRFRHGLWIACAQVWHKSTSSDIPRLRPRLAGYSSRRDEDDAKFYLALDAAAAFGSRIVTGATSDGDSATALNHILEEGMQRSQVVGIVQHLSDDIGSRLTNSPGMRQAESWSEAQFRQWGLSAVRRDPFEFGRGWTAIEWHVRMESPRALQLKGIPVAWTPGTGSTLRAPIVVAPIAKAADLLQWHGKVAGKIVLVSLPREVPEDASPIFHRLTEEDLAKRSLWHPPTSSQERDEAIAASLSLPAQIDSFLHTEGALAILVMSGSDYQAVRGVGAGFEPGAARTVPAMELGAEDYRRLVRLADRGAAPVLSLFTAVEFHDEDTKAYNILGDIPGADPKAGYVLMGAHLDSWHAADGAMDNAAGAAVVMEAARILSRLGVHPRRTIRFALWAGEEEGLLGSAAYINRYLRAGPSTPTPRSIPGRALSWRPTAARSRARRLRRT